jgi:hypothetical protein
VIGSVIFTEHRPAFYVHVEGRQCFGKTVDGRLRKGAESDINEKITKPIENEGKKQGTTFDIKCFENFDMKEQEQTQISPVVPRHIFERPRSH